MNALLKSRRIALTGARGCLGQIIGRHFEAQGADVVRVSRTGGPGHLDLASFLARPGEVDTVLHLAWSSLPSSAEQQPGIEEREDFPLLLRLLETLAANPRRPHFVFFSSGGTVYGNARDGQPHREDDPCEPIGRHGRAKLAAERLIREPDSAAGVDWTILRISNPYGFPVPASHRQGIIPLALAAARAGRELTLWGDGSARKDFLHHTDFCAAIECVVRQRLTGLFNIAQGRSHAIRDVLRAVEDAAGRKLVVRHTPAQPWDVHDSLLDNSLFRTATGWQPAVDLAEGIRRAAALP